MRKIINPTYISLDGVIEGDPVTAVKELKDAPGRDIVQCGHGQLSRTPVEHRLLDELTVILSYAVAA